MGVRIEPKAELHPRHLVDARMIRERRVIASRYRASARDLFPALRERLLASRPIIGTKATFPKLSLQKRAPRGIIAKTEPIYGAPTFRNVIDENGRHV